MKVSTWRAMATALGVAQSAMVACGGSSNGSGGAGGDPSASSSANAASSSSASSSGAECAMKTTRQLCFDCCGTDLPAAYDQLVLDILNACACSSPDGGMVPCMSDTSCTMDCQAMKPSGVCLMCLNNNAITTKDPCVTAGYTACQSDPLCSPMLDCETTYCKQAM